MTSLLGKRASRPSARARAAQEQEDDESEDDAQHAQVQLVLPPVDSDSSDDENEHPVEQQVDAPDEEDVAPVVQKKGETKAAAAKRAKDEEKARWSPNLRAYRVRISISPGSGVNPTYCTYQQFCGCTLPSRPGRTPPGRLPYYSTVHPSFRQSTPMTTRTSRDNHEPWPRHRQIHFRKYITVTLRSHPTTNHGWGPARAKVSLLSYAPKSNSWFAWFIRNKAHGH